MREGKCRIHLMLTDDDEEEKDRAKKFCVFAHFSDRLRLASEDRFFLQGEGISKLVGGMRLTKMAIGVGSLCSVIILLSSNAGSPCSEHFIPLAVQDSQGASTPGAERRDSGMYNSCVRPPSRVPSGSAAALVDTWQKQPCFSVKKCRSRC
jgi:hypothetical protein